MTVTSRTAMERWWTKMSDYERYISAMTQAKRLLKNGLISYEEYADFDTIMANKYGVSLCSICRPIDLIYPSFRANMCDEEV